MNTIKLYRLTLLGHVLKLCFVSEQFSVMAEKGWRSRAWNVSRLATNLLGVYL